MTAATARRSVSKKKGKKQPEWTAISFNKVEEWREKLGLSKSAMAEALGVTNSTYHNWQRGDSVPYESIQERIKERIEVLEKHAKAGTTPPKPKKGASPKKTTSKKQAKKTKAKRQTKGTAKSSKQKGTAKTGRRRQGRANSGTPSTFGVGSADPVSAITVAFIQSRSQNGPVTQQQVYSFIEGLHEIL